MAAGALLALLQLPISRAFVVVPAAQRQPAAAPRFDTFCEQIVGRWVQRDGAVFDVEEVMRACGGAVQGVKEGALYHNRADDGFLYFPCGSYSAGPASLQAEGELVSSLSFPSSRRRQLVRLERSTELRRPEEGWQTASTCLWRERVENAAAAGPGSDGVKLLTLERELGCWSRAGPFQPARVKWQCQNLQDSAEWAADHVCWQDDGATWVTQSDAFSAWDFAGVVPPVDPSPAGGRLVQVGALCWESREAKAITRRYCADGYLQAVVLSEGHF